LAEWVKKLATAVSSAFSALSRTGKLQQVPRACARGGMGTVCDGLYGGTGEGGCQGQPALECCGRQVWGGGERRDAHSPGV
jgi:hypothetical protein